MHIVPPPTFNRPVTEDNVVRKDSTPEAYARLKPAFDPRHGTVTAGNSSVLTDGASALLLMTESKAKALGYRPLGYLRSWAYAGLDPNGWMLMGPTYAAPAALDAAGARLKDMAVIDMHEAFAAQVLCNVQDARLEVVRAVAARTRRGDRRGRHGSLQRARRLDRGRPPVGGDGRAHRDHRAARARDGAAAALASRRDARPAASAPRWCWRRPRDRGPGGGPRSQPKTSILSIESGATASPSSRSTTRGRPRTRSRWRCRRSSSRPSRGSRRTRPSPRWCSRAESRSGS